MSRGQPSIAKFFSKPLAEPSAGPSQANNAEDIEVRESEVSSAKRVKIDKLQESWLKGHGWSI